MRSTKKTETPGLWLRLVESFGATCSFGEVRLSEAGLMEKFGISVDSLPRVVAVVGEKGAGKEKDEVLPYEGPTDFERLSDFIRDTSRGGLPLVNLRKELEDHRREMKALKAELEQEREAVKLARAEVARSKLGQVGQVESVKKALETELQDARDKERAAQDQLAADTERTAAIIAELERERNELVLQIKAYEDVQQQRVLMLSASNMDVFLASTTRPLKAVLFTTKADTPPLWSQLAEAQSMTTAFGVVKHVETDLMARFELNTSDLPRICIWSSNKEEPVVYDGEVKLDALSSFLKDAVHGGDTVIAMRQQVHTAVRQVEELEAELKRVKLEAAAKEDEVSRHLADAQQQHHAQVAELEAQLQTLSQSSEAELGRVAQSARVRLKEAEDTIKTLEHELMSERSSTTRQLEQMRAQAGGEVARMQGEVARVHQSYADARYADEMLDAEIQALGKLARCAERAVGRVACAVQVALTHTHRERERQRERERKGRWGRGDRERERERKRERQRERKGLALACRFRV